MQLALLISGFALLAAPSALAASGTTTTTWDWYAEYACFLELISTNIRIVVNQPAAGHKTLKQGGAS